MGSPANLLRKLQGFDPDKAVDDALQENTDYYGVLQRKQLIEGKNSSGGEIRPAYASDYYSRMKNRLNSKPGLGNPDLKLTGDRNEAMTVTLDSDSLKLDSDVEYNKYLEERYSAKQIWGLDDENMGKFRADVRESLQRIVTTETGLL